MLARCADANPIGKDSSIASLASPGVKLMDAYLARLADRAGTHVAVGRAIKLFLDEAESLTDIELPFFDMAGNITNTLKDDGGARVSASCERILDCRFLTSTWRQLWDLGCCNLCYTGSLATPSGGVYHCSRATIICHTGSTAQTCSCRQRCSHSNPASVFASVSTKSKLPRYEL